MKENTEEDIIKNFKSEYGELNSMIGTDEFGMEYISSSICQNSDMNDDLIDKLTDYFNEKKLKVGFISSFLVKDEYRGFGVGSKLMNTFKKEIMSKTDVDILLARTENKQHKGFELENFYKKNGFEPVFLEDGDLLMVSKGYELILDDVLDLKNIRKQQIEFYSKNPNNTERGLKSFEFAKAKEKKINDSLKFQKFEKFEKVDNDTNMSKSTISSIKNRL